MSFFLVHEWTDVTGAEYNAVLCADIQYVMVQYVLTGKGFMMILVNFQGCSSCRILTEGLGLKEGGKYT